MKKMVLILVLGLLLVAANLYAQGNLIVNGELGVGTSSPTSKFHVQGTDANGFRATVERSNITGGVTKSSSTFTTTISDTDWNEKRINNFNASVYYIGRATGADPYMAVIRGYLSDFLFNTTVPGTHTLSEVANASYSLAIGSLNTQGVTITNYYGIKHTMSDIGGGVFNGDNWYGAYFGNPNSADFQPTNLYGLYIEGQTRGTNNYGLALSGTGAGADITFGNIGVTGQDARIYFDGSEIRAVDAAGNDTAISPHDPETGEWVFYSRNINTGRVVKINMDKLVKAVEKLTGETFMVETFMDVK